MGTVGSRGTSPRSRNYSRADHTPPSLKALAFKRHPNDRILAKTALGDHFKSSDPAGTCVIIDDSPLGQALGSGNK
jgi:hypothetical protein